MPDEVKLEPCPWCFSSAHEQEWTNINGPYECIEVQCDACGRSVRGVDAIAAWNALHRKPKWITYDGTESTLPDEERVYLIGHQSTGRLSRDWQKPCWWVDADHDFCPLKIGDEWMALPIGGE